MKTTEKLKTTVVWCVAMSVAVCAVCGLTNLAAYLLDIELPPQPSLKELLDSHGVRLAQLLALVLIGAPVIEETLFRWLLWRVPSRLVKRRWAAVAFAVISATAFTAAHYIRMPFPDNAFLGIFVIGIAHCGLYAKTGSLWCPMLSHALFNAANVAILFAFPEFALK